MKTKNTFFKTMLFAMATSMTLQAQTPLVHLKFENNLTNEGSSSLTFSVDGSNSTGVSVPYGTGNEGSAINFSAIPYSDDPDNPVTDSNLPLVDNGGDNDAQIQSNGNSSITGSAARTISAWVKYADRNPNTKGAHTIVHLGNPSASATNDPQGRITFQLEGNNNRFQVAVAQGNVQSSYAESVIEDGNWHHVAFTYPSGGTLADIKIYVDGSIATITNDGGSNSTKILNTTSDKIYIGTTGANSAKWFDGGGIDDVRIYDIELTAAQMLVVYNGGSLSISGFESGELKAYPNTVEDFLYLETTNNNALDVSVYDITGRNIMNTTGNSVDMSNLTSGMYIVKVKEGDKEANLKIIKK